MALGTFLDVVVAVGAICGPLVGVAALYVSQRQAKSNERASAAVQAIAETYGREVTALRDEIAALRERVGTGPLSSAEKAAMESQRLAQRQREFEYKKNRDALKAVGWMLKNLGTEE